jgi:hypothetical protein
MMKKSRGRLSLDRPAVYEIKVPGRLDEHWSDSFEGMTVSVEEGNDAATTTTTITGLVADQAALHGLLQQLYTLGLPLLSVNRIESNASLGVS